MYACACAHVRVFMIHYKLLRARILMAKHKKGASSVLSYVIYARAERCGGGEVYLTKTGRKMNEKKY